MHGRGGGSRGHRPGHSYSASSAQKAQLTNAYSELGSALSSTQIKAVGNYTLGRVIGEGSFGKVRLAVNKLTSQRCAIKQIPRSAAPPLLTREIHHHRRFHHPHVLRLFEVIATEANIWLVSELCAGGELFDYLVEKGRLGENEGRRIFGQLCLGVGYIHAQGVVHRDLKLENVLLDERCNVKIADFGFGREFEQRRLMETFCGTTGYAAPEMLAGKKYTGEEVDIWSLGIILYTLLTGSLPFDDDDDDVMKEKILAGEYVLPNWLSEESRNLISRILRQEPLDRLSIKQILGHEWFTRPHTMSPSSADYYQSLDVLPHTIPEETGSSLRATPTESGNFVHLGSQQQQDSSVDGSVASTSSWQSASDSDIGLGIQSSRSNTPITSDESEDVRTHSPSSKQKGKAVDRNWNDGNRIHRNASQTTITKSESLLSLSRQMYTSPLMTRSESSSFRFPPPSPHMLDASLHGSPSLPIPAHSRTPSRTKRRSVGSTISERMLPSHAAPIIPDYLSMLSNPTPAPFSTALEKQMLDSLSLIGFDTGQIVHSVRTDACDASGAIWWMLTLKAEDREVELNDAASIAPQKSSSVSSLSHSVGPQSIATPQDQYTSQLEGPDGVGEMPTLQEEETLQDPEGLEDTQTRQSTAAPQDKAPDIVEYGGLAHTPSPRKQRAQSTSGVRISSTSAPSFSPNLRSIEQSSPTPELPGGNLHLGSTPDKASPSKMANIEKSGSAFESMKAERVQSKPRSSSVSTASVLQRATSVLGVSASRKDRSEDIDGKSFFGDTGRSTPSLLGTGLFGRKVSSSGPTVEKALVPTVSKEGLNPNLGLAEAKLGNATSNPDTSTPATDEYKPPASPAPQTGTSSRSTPIGSPSSRSLRSPGTSAAIKLPENRLIDSGRDALGSSTISTKSSRGSKSLFTSFRHWFNDDRRKQKRQRQSSTPLPLDTLSLPRTESLRRPAIHGPSPLKRPPLARIPSNAPTSAGVSRRNSSTSARRIPNSEQASPLLGHTRRRSDSSRHSFSSINGARTPTSDRGDRGRDVGKVRDSSSLPLSQSGIPVSAEVYNAARKRHGRASSTGSAGSRHSTMIAGSPVAAYRRTPAVTQVRRLSTPRNDRSRQPHSRHHSNPSSIHSNSSAHSSISNGVDDDHNIIEEEGENVDIDGDEDHVGAERSRALQKLSGNSPLSTPDTEVIEESSSHAAATDFLKPSPEPYVSKEGTHNRLRQVQPSGHARPTSSSSNSVAYGGTIFAAHKVVNPFGTPNGSLLHANLHNRTSRDIEKPKLRDVFKNKKSESEGDWVDEDSGVEIYTGGFGQGSSKPLSSSSSASSSSSTTGQAGRLYPSGVAGTDATATRKNTSSSVFGEGRYAGIGLARDDTPPTGMVSWRNIQGARAPQFKRAAIVEEEEEEEEEDGV